MLDSLNIYKRNLHDVQTILFLSRVSTNLNNNFLEITSVPVQYHATGMASPTLSLVYNPQTLLDTIGDSQTLPRHYRKFFDFSRHFHTLGFSNFSSNRHWWSLPDTPGPLRPLPNRSWYKTLSDGHWVIKWLNIL